MSEEPQKSEKPQGEELLTAAQVAARKGVSLPAVYGAINDGRLPSVRILGRPGVTVVDCDNWQPSHGGRRSGAGRRKEGSDADTGNTGA